MLLRLDEHRAQGRAGYDLALTEVLDADRHYFVVDVGSDARARRCCRRCRTSREAMAASGGAERMVAATAAHMGRTLDTDGLKDLLYRNHEHPALGRWWQTAA